MYYGARYYDPALGRFIAPDTIVPDVPDTPLSALTVNFSDPAFLKEIGRENRWRARQGIVQEQVSLSDSEKPRGLSVVQSFQEPSAWPRLNQTGAFSGVSPSSNLQARGPADPQNLNRYAYVRNNALRYTDPTGHYEEAEIERYLRDLYGEHWKRYWDAWQADKIFWAMLRAAQNGDRLYAPTTSLGVGLFGAKEGSFTFTSEDGAGLWLYQGRGPYALEMPNRQFREGFSAQAIATAHPFIGTDENIGLTWEQPLYNYTPHGPEPTGFTRRVSYTYAGVFIDLGASSSIPTGIAAIAALLRFATKGAVKAFLAGPVGTGLFAADVGVAINEGININYQLQVDYKDTRTYLSPWSRCLSPCFKAAP